MCKVKVYICGFDILQRYENSLKQNHIKVKYVSEIMLLRKCARFELCEDSYIHIYRGKCFLMLFIRICYRQIYRAISMIKFIYISEIKIAHIIVALKTIHFIVPRIN